MEDIRGIQHPLQTPLVLECIFKNLGVSDLMACRQVCRVWREEATKIMRPLVIVDIKNGKEQKLGVDDFLELVRNEASTFTDSPFVNEFHIMNFNEAEIDPAFWEFCGRSIKSLYLITASFQTDDEFGHAIFESCPNLETLRLQDVHVNSQDNSGLQPEVWVPPRFPQNRNLKSLDLDSSKINGRTRMEILSQFPCLEKLNLVWIETTCDWVFRTLAILREHDSHGWPLKSVGVDFNHLEEPLAILPVLVEGNLALEEFDAKGIHGPEHGILLRNILEAHANTLKKLNLVSFIDFEVEAVEPLNNMRLEKLECLDLFGVDLSSINLLRNVPNLRRLDIIQARAFRRQPEDPNDDGVLASCTELNVDLDDGQLEAGELHSLLRRLPNLEKLVLRDCDNEMFGMICYLCPKLTYLNLWRSEVDDCGISGLDIEDVVRINEEGANGWTWWRPITVARPNLSNLQNLKWFSLRHRPGDHGHELSFCTALCGVQQLPQIQHLHLELESCLSPTLGRLMERYPWVDVD